MSARDLIRTALANVPGAMPAITEQAAAPTDGVNDAGAGESPVTPPIEGKPLPPIPDALPPLPAVGVDAKVPPGAPKSSPTGAPARVVGMGNVTLLNAEKAVNIIPGSVERRRILIWLHTAPGLGYVYLAPDARQDRTGAPLPAVGNGPLELTCSDPLYVYWPLEGVPGASPVVAFVVEPAIGC